MTSQGDVAERKKNRELDALRRDTSAVARLLKQARMDEIRSDVILAKSQLTNVESRLAGKSEPLD
jgi:hypothetical protein|tara:strand:- start:256 stop:450 length:195 start_codon:yes stop_codon:yes gene_type:complete